MDAPPDIGSRVKFTNQDLMHPILLIGRVATINGHPNPDQSTAFVNWESGTSDWVYLSMLEVINEIPRKPNENHPNTSV